MSDLIESYLCYLRAGGRSDATLKLRAETLRMFEAALPRGLDDVSPAELAAILARYRDWTLYTYDQSLRGYYGWASSGPDPDMPWDPTTQLLRPPCPASLPNPVTDEELHLALRLAPVLFVPAILLAAKAGLRVSEIAQLERADVDERRILIRRGKGGRPHTVPTDAEIWQWVEPMPPGRVVVCACSRSKARGCPVTGAQLTRCARRIFNRIGLPGVHLHRFRHWYGTELARRGVDAWTVQQLMRHASIHSTQGYVLIAGVQRAAAVALLPSLLRF